MRKGKIYLWILLICGILEWVALGFGIKGAVIMINITDEAPITILYPYIPVSVIVMCSAGFGLFFIFMIMGYIFSGLLLRQWQYSSVKKITLTTAVVNLVGIPITNTILTIICLYMNYKYTNTDNEEEIKELAKVHY